MPGEKEATNERGSSCYEGFFSNSGNEEIKNEERRT